MAPKDVSIDGMTWHDYIQRGVPKTWGPSGHKRLSLLSIQHIIFSITVKSDVTKGLP